MLFLVALVSAMPASAHVSAGGRDQTIILTADGQMLVRMPVPLLFSREIARAREVRGPITSPVLAVEQTGFGPRYRVRLDVIAAQPAVWTPLLADAFALNTPDGPLATTVTEYRLHGRAPAAPFATVTEAEAALSGPAPRLDPLFGEAYLDIRFEIEGEGWRGPVTLGTDRPAVDLPPSIRIDSHIVDARLPLAVSYEVEGQLTAPFDLAAPPPAIVSFAERGVQHVVASASAILLGLCLALGAGWSQRLGWLLAAVLVGRAVAPAAAGVGFTPVDASGAAWMQAGIVVAGAAVAGAAWRGWRVAVPLALAAGLLQGVLLAAFFGERFSTDHPQFLPALLGFGAGAALGQIALALVFVGVWELARRRLSASAPA
ncbi:MAG: HupE/UreJ family protein [Pseudomonadota bacterium]